MKGNPAVPGGSLMSKPTWSNAFGCSATSVFLFLWVAVVRTNDPFTTGCREASVGAFPEQENRCHARDWIGGNEGLDRFGGSDRRHGKSRERPSCDLRSCLREVVP